MITVIGLIKNSADIIESYIRANSLFADNFVLLDNMSTDNTIPILNELKKEGYQIEILSDPESAYLQSMKMNLLIRYVVRNYNSDWIIPLDDDEVLMAKEVGHTPKEMVLSLPCNNLYFVKWRNYIPTDEDDYEEISPILRQKYCFSDSMESFLKVIIPKQIALQDNAMIVQGNHDMVGTDAEKILLTDLCLAHFPCRSKEQVMSKGLIGWTNNLAMYNRKANNGSHWQKIYEMVKSGRDITTEMLWQICLEYMEPCDENDVMIELNPLSLPEEAFLMNYTGKNEVDPLNNYFCNTEQLAKKYAELSQKMNEIHS